MGKRMVWAIVALFVLWTLLDMLVHGVLLRPIYEASAGLWRPPAEMNMSLSHLVTLVYTACFVLIYGLLIEKKSVARAVQYGLLFGLAGGVGMGFGTYSYMPIPFDLACYWFAGTIVECGIAGGVLGAIVKTPAVKAEPAKA